MTFGVDYESGPRPDNLAAAGVEFVCRYVSTPGNPKNLTRPEAAALRKAGISIVVVFETAADRALSGYQAGAADARAARVQATGCGYPKTAAVYFTVDFDAQPAELAKVVSYIRGAASVLTPARTGVYGGLATVKACLDAKVCKFAWQTLAWSRDEWDPRAQLRQTAINETIAGHSVDRNEAVAANYGQWKPSPAKPKVVPVVPHTPAPAPPVAISGPKGGLIGRRTLPAALRLLPRLLRRFKRVTLTS